MIVLGLDPGSVRIGYGLIQAEGNKLSWLKSGLLKVQPLRAPGRLATIEKDLNAIVREFRPDRVGLEKLFFMRNQKTALAVAETRGVILNALHKNRLPVFEVSPSEVKLAVTGYGQAPKEAVAKMVRYFLKMPPQKIIDDASDALAIAIAVSNGSPLTS